MSNRNVYSNGSTMCFVLTDVVGVVMSSSTAIKIFLRSGQVEERSFTGTDANAVASMRFSEISEAITVFNS